MSRDAKKYEDDDGRTIADMSDIQGQNLFSFKLPDKKSRNEEINDRPWENRMSREERRATVFGALGASLAIGMCYIVGLGAVIAFLLLLWH